MPAVNQIEIHPYLTQNELVSFDASHGIATEAWSPIAQGAVLDDPARRIGELHAGQDAGAGDTPVAHPARDIVFPKSVTPARMRENFEIFDFELGPEDMDRITALNRNERTGPDPDTFAYIPR